MQCWFYYLRITTSLKNSISEPIPNQEKDKKELIYVVNTHHRKKRTKKCHVNLIKPYFKRIDDKPILGILDILEIKKEDLYKDRDP